jgi:TetR/AcrR family transcriptional regulator, transcriptional repressor for nem operon
VEELVARYGAEHKDETRRRIIEAAGRRFKQDGIDGSGVATLMKDAGLTNGAFYAHFGSKEDLVAAVVAAELRAQAENFAAAAPGRPGVVDVVYEYLSPQHRDNPNTGCPSAALLDEVGRCADVTKQAYADGAEAIIEEIATRLAPDDPRSARGTTLGLYTMLIGTLQLARAVADRELSDEILAQGLENALALMGEQPRR